MYKDYKVARPVQLLSLFHMEQVNINAVKNAASSGLFPQEIVRANKVMNIVSSMHFLDIYGINLIGQYQPTKQEYDQAKDLFEMVRLEEIDELDASFANIQREKIIAADGATNYMRECVDTMDEKTFEIWMKYHLSICERTDLIGATNHSLDILRKN